MYDFLQHYADRRGIRLNSFDQLRYSLDTFSKFLGRKPVHEDFTDDAINRFISWLCEQGYAHETVKTKRGGIITLWNAAATDGLIPWPDKVRKLAPKQRLPRAWTEAQISAILQACASVKGNFRHHRCINRATFTAAVTLTCYETGYRRSDLLLLRRSDIQDDGRILLVQSKTNYPHLAQIQPETLRLIDLIGTAGREYLFGGVVSSSWLGRMFKKVCKQAGVDAGSLKWLRRSGATHTEKAAPGTGYRYLGQTTPRVAFASYIDLLQLDQRPFAPPRLPAIEINLHRGC